MNEEMSTTGLQIHQINNIRYYNIFLWDMTDYRSLEMLQYAAHYTHPFIHLHSFSDRVSPHYN